MNDPQQFIPGAVMSPAVPGALTLGLSALALVSVGTPGPFFWPLSVLCGLGAGVAALHTASLVLCRPAAHSDVPELVQITRILPHPAPPTVPRTLVTPEPEAALSPWQALPLPPGWTLEPDGQNAQVCRSDRRRFLITVHPPAPTRLQAGVTCVVWRPEWPDQPTRQGQAWKMGGPHASLIAFLEVL